MKNNSNGTNVYGFPLWFIPPKIKKVEEAEEIVDPWDFVVDLHEGDITEK